MLKLIRNALASKKCLIDADGNSIKWDSFEKLVEFGKTNMFDITHKLNQKHMQWNRRIMKVDIAAQTLSNTTANAFEYLMNARIPGFENVTGEIKFIKCFNNLFDIFNTKNGLENENLLKNALCPQNQRVVFSLFEEYIPYIKGLKFIDEKDGKEKKIISSKIQTGFRGEILLFTLFVVMPSFDIYLCLSYKPTGFINNMHVLKLIYK